MRHLCDEAKALQPLVRLYLEDQTKGSLLAARNPRVWVASTWCGLAFHGEGAFPHNALKFTVDGVDCPQCLAEAKWVKPLDPSVQWPNMRHEAELHEASR